MLNGVGEEGGSDILVGSGEDFILGNLGGEVDEVKGSPNVGNFGFDSVGELVKEGGVTSFV